MESLRRTLFVTSLVVAGVACRFLFTDLPNFAPVGALALFAGAAFVDKRIALILPMIVMLISDWIIGFHPSVLYVYIGMAVYVALGIWAGRGFNAAKFISATFAGSVSFFLITNFGYFLGYCPKTWQGLIDCYAMAIPFFRNTLAGDFLFGTVLFSSLAIAEWLMPGLRAVAPAKTG